MALNFRDNSIRLFYNEKYVVYGLRGIVKE